MKSILTTLGLLGALGAANAQFFQPDSAVAGSTFSSLYNIGNTIDGSGLPVGFTPASPHGAYSAANGGNHWTTLLGAILNGTAWAEYSFTNPVTIGTFHMWNHQSNGGIANNPDYDVTRFNLKLLDASNTVIFSLLNVTAQEDIATAQSFSFNPVSGVKMVRFEILANARPANDRYTGLAEVGFDSRPVPEPATMIALGMGLSALIRRKRKAQ